MTNEYIYITNRSVDINAYQEIDSERGRIIIPKDTIIEFNRNTIVPLFTVVVCIENNKIGIQIPLRLNALIDLDWYNQVGSTFFNEHISKFKVRYRNGVLEPVRTVQPIATIYDARFVAKLMDPRENKKTTFVTETKLDNLETLDDTFFIETFKYIPVTFGYGSYGFYDPKKETTILMTSDGHFNGCKTGKLSNFRNKFTATPLYYFCKFKVKNYVDSSKIFKFTELKKKMVGIIVPVSGLELNVKCKNSTDKQNTIFCNYNDRNYRFILDDLEIIFPNISGYNPPKDRVIKASDKVRVINDKHSRFKKNDIVKIHQLKKVGNKTYAGIKVKNKIVYERVKKFKKI